VKHLNIRLPFRLAKLTAWLFAVAVAAVALSGCGTGQIAQTAAQEPAVNGNRLTIKNVALRDIRIQATQNNGDFLQPGRTVELVLVAVNNSSDVTDRLTGITSDIGNVTVSGDAKLPAGGSLFIGMPEGPVVAPGPLQSSGAAKATVNLSKPITNGLTYNFTFKFEKAGEGTVDVPIAAGLAEPHEPASNHS
jgi:copper(I)-binding protein